MNNSAEHGQAAILFVDDEENILKALRRLFIDENYDIFTAPSGEEGLDILKSTEVAVIVSDHRMPGMSGVEFLEYARQISPDSGRLILTGHADMTMAIDAINKGGAQRYIMKPWNNDDLLSAVRWAAERYRLIKENRYLTDLTLKQNGELRKWSSELEMHVQQQTIELTYKNRDLVELNERLRRGGTNCTPPLDNLLL